MSKSRTALAVTAVLAAAPAQAQQGGAGALVEGQREALRAAMRLDCRRAEDEAEIIVCGSRDEERRYRLEPLRSRASGAAGQAGGEQRAAMAAGSETCTPVGRDQRCSGGLDLIGIGFTIARAIAQAAANRD